MFNCKIIKILKAIYMYRIYFYYTIRFYILKFNNLTLKDLIPGLFLFQFFSKNDIIILENIRTIFKKFFILLGLCL